MTDAGPQVAVTQQREAPTDRQPEPPAAPPERDARGVAHQKAARMLREAGVTIDGDAPWDLQVHDPRLFGRVFRQGTLGLGEAYMDGWWDVPEPDRFFDRVMRAGLDRPMRGKAPELLVRARHTVLNLQRRGRAFLVGKQHYDLGNRLYEAMLDKRMVYSCGYWRRAKDLDQAQEHKLELICQKLRLEPGMRLLDIGCGWGSLLRYAARHHGVEGVGLTISKEQTRRARKRCAGLPVEIRLQDYQTMPTEPFDAVVSVGMFEHVGHKNHRAYMDTAHRMLRPGGLHLLHTIGRPQTAVAIDPWIGRYIFPNSMLPSMQQITAAADGRWVVEDVHNFGQDYDPTLMAWHRNFEAAWDDLRGDRDERFRRMWRYYLLSSAGGFRARRLQLWQVVLSPDRGVDGGYEPVR